MYEYAFHHFYFEAREVGERPSSEVSSFTWDIVFEGIIVGIIFDDLIDSKNLYSKKFLLLVKLALKLFWALLW